MCAQRPTLITTSPRALVLYNVTVFFVGDGEEMSIRGALGLPADVGIPRILPGWILLPPESSLLLLGSLLACDRLGPPDPPGAPTTTVVT